MVSIIVPVYNVEKYLRQCIDSILQQTYQDIEVLIIENQSTDASAKICDEYIHHRCVKVVHSEKKGPSEARNIGLEIATGAYITFVDSDDYLEPTMLEKMVEIIQTDDAIDLVECQVGTDDGMQLHTCLLDKPYTVTGDEFLEKWFANVYSGGVPRTAVWSKLYKADFWKNRRFPEGHVNEDYYLTAQAFGEARKVYVINEALYIHRNNNIDSITHQPQTKADVFLEEQYRNIKEYCSVKSEKIARLGEINYYRKTLRLYVDCVNVRQMHNAECVKSILKQKKKEILRSEQKKTMCLQYYLFFICPPIYAYVCRLKDMLQSM